MTRENLLFSIIGLLLGFIVGFIFASTMSQRSATAPGMPTSQNLPADHPPIESGNPQSGQQVFAQVQEAMRQARSEPNNFDAQVTAAKLEYQIQRYDEAVEFLLKANQLKPNSYEVIVMLAEANLEGAHYDQAEKWYKAALMIKPGEEPLLASVAYMHLKKGDARAAEKAIASLEKAFPSNQNLAQFHERLASLKSGDKPN